jgi:hypothetical protein
MARVRRGDGESAWILAVVPLHADELALDRRDGAPALGAALDRARVTELLDPRRPSAAAVTPAPAPRPVTPSPAATPPAPTPLSRTAPVTQPRPLTPPAAPAPAEPWSPAARRRKRFGFR